MTPFGQTLVRTTTIPHHTECGPATTAHNARLRLDRVRDLRDFRFQVIELNANAGEEEVAEIFVRTNSILIPTQAKFNLRSLSGIGGVRSAM